MMKHNLQKLQKEAQHLRLSRQEKAVMHTHLMELVHGSGAAAPRSTPGLYYFFAPQFAMPMAALLVVLLGGGTAYASQSALPGDPLYAVKVSVGEPIMGALAFSIEDKIKFHTEVAQTRIEEAEVLASQDRLDAKAAAQIESNLDEHLAKRGELVAVLDEEDPETSVALSAELDSSIAAHGDVLLALGSESESSATREHSDALASKVRFARAGHAGDATSVSLAMAKSAYSVAPQAPEPMAMGMMATSEAEDARTAMVQEDTPTSSQEITGKKQVRQEKNALSLGARATSTLKSLMESAADMSEKIDNETKEKLEARFEKINTLIMEGDTALAQKDFDRAAENFSEALEREATLSTFLMANQKFNRDILKNLLGNDSRWGDDEE